jgi:hypothetical protein
MAIAKTQILENGATVTYHKIGSVHLCCGVIKCNLLSYESPETRAEDFPLSAKAFKLTATTEEEESMGIRALCYKKIKELPDWADAEDC